MCFCSELGQLLTLTMNQIRFFSSIRALFRYGSNFLLMLLLQCLYGFLSFSLFSRLFTLLEHLLLEHFDHLNDMFLCLCICSIICVVVFQISFFRVKYKSLTRSDEVFNCKYSL